MRKIFLASMLLLISGAAHAAGPATPGPDAQRTRCAATAHGARPLGCLTFLSLVRLDGPPVACSADRDGALALTSAYALCVCKGEAAAWVKQTDTATACDWKGR